MNTVRFSQVRTRRMGVLFFANVSLNGLCFDVEVGVGSTVSARNKTLYVQTRVELISAFMSKGFDPSIVDTLAIID